MDADMVPESKEPRYLMEHLRRTYPYTWAASQPNLHAPAGWNRDLEPEPGAVDKDMGAQ